MNPNNVNEAGADVGDGNPAPIVQPRQPQNLQVLVKQRENSSQLIKKNR